MLQTIHNMLIVVTRCGGAVVAHLEARAEANGTIKLNGSAEAVRLLVAGEVRAELLIRGEVKLADLPKFFAENADRSVMKAAVRP